MGLIAIALAAILGFSFEQEISVFLSGEVPVTTDKSFVFYEDLLRISIYELLWWGLLLIIALLFYNNSSWIANVENLEKQVLNRSVDFSIATIILVSLLIIFIAFIILQQFPNSSDEYVYLYQAETLKEGTLYRQAHPLKESFIFNHIAVKDGISVGRFPVGWPLILAIFLFLGVPAAMVNPILGAATLIVFYNFAKRLYGYRIALWSLVVFACSAFFLFNSASFFSHASCCLETLVFVYCIYLYLDKKNIAYGLLAGLALGLIMLIRYYTAVLLFLPFFIILLYRYKFSAFYLFVLIGLGALPCLAGFLLYNYEITGNPLTPVTVWGYKNEGLGFINGHTFLKGVEHIVRRFFMFSYWCAPALLIFYFKFIFEKLRSKESRYTVPEDYLFIIFLVGYFFYYEIGGNQYGPRFYYEAYPFLVLLVANKVLSSESQIAKIFLYASVIVMIIRIPFISYREHAIVDQRQDVFDLVRERHVSNAVILISSGTCDIRPMPGADLTRNDPYFKNDVLYALDKREWNTQLMAYYKHKHFYRYERQPDHENGRLIKIR
jgi:hypothetical protein